MLSVAVSNSRNALKLGCQSALCLHRAGLHCWVADEGWLLILEQHIICKVCLSVRAAQVSAEGGRERSLCMLSACTPEVDPASLAVPMQVAVPFGKHMLTQW